MISTTQNEVPITPSIPSKPWMFERSWRLIAFGFGSGLSHLAPGTIGTLWTWAAALAVQYFYPNMASPQTAVFLIAAFLIGIWACGKTGEDLNAPDHSGMVWDEIVAFWIILWLLLPSSAWHQLLAFGVFRFFDIAKPGPIAWADQFFKSWQASEHQKKWVIYVRGLGVMLDDLIAAFFTLIVVSLFIHLGF